MLYRGRHRDNYKWFWGDYVTENGPDPQEPITGAAIALLALIVVALTCGGGLVAILWAVLG